MRIIGGKFKGRKLAKIKGDEIRPTADRVREAIFNINGSDIRGRRVLDIFAGSGALGLEAISRGASFCVFIDKGFNATVCIRKNISLCRAEKQSLVIKKDWLEINEKISNLEPFDIVFADPPYKMTKDSLILEKLYKNKLLNDGATVVIEHSKDSNIETPAYSENITLYDKRKYGRIAVSFFRYKK